MEIKLPVFVDASSLSEIDAFLQRDGVFLPLRLAAEPDGAREAGPARAVDRRFANAGRIAAIAERVAAVDRWAAPILAATSRADAVGRATRGEQGFGPDAPSTAELAALRLAAEHYNRGMPSADEIARLRRELALAWPNDATATYQSRLTRT